MWSAKAGIVALDLLELRDVFRADQRSLVSKAASGLKQCALVAAGGLGQHAQGCEAGLVGDPGATPEDVLDIVGGIGDLIFDAKGTTMTGIPAEEVKRLLGDVEAQEQLVGRVDTLVLGDDLHSRGLLS